MLMLAAISLAGCKGERMDNLASGYPEDIAPILRQTCATAGCHNAQSTGSSGGLNLESWEDLFKGSRGGSAVIPYAPELSFLMFSVNNDSSLGPVLPPTMPLNQTHLTSQEYNALWQWIDEGARNAEGQEPFPQQASRRKWYAAHNQCDQVAVFDAESRQIMRYVPVGKDPGKVEEVLSIEVSPDGEDWYVVFWSTNDHIERYSTLTDEKVADIQLGDFAWTGMDFSADGRFAFVSSDYWTQMVAVDLQTNAVVGAPATFNVEVLSPAAHPARQEVYLAQPSDNGLFAVAYDNNGQLGAVREVDLEQHIPPAIPGDVWPHELLFLPDGSRYFVTCRHSKELRVFDGQTDSLLEVVALPAEPFKLAHAQGTGRLFISCMEDLAAWGGDPFRRGSVLALDAETLQIERTIYAGYQPYDMYVDEANGQLVVANRNTDVNGPASHHESICGDRNGYVTLIDLNSLQVIPDFKSEVLVDPVGLAGKP